MHTTGRMDDNERHEERAGRFRHVEDREATGGLSPVMLRTGAFLLGGLGMLLLGWSLQPRIKTAKIEPEEQRVLFPELSDAAKAASLEIVSYDDELSTLHPFKVMQAGGVWVLPAHQNYPADAKEQLAAAATSLVDLKMLDVVSKSAADHETYGVIEPDPEKIKPGMTGVGQLVEIRDASGNKLARLVIGKEDKRLPGGESSGRSLRFVRKAGQDPVYRVEIDTSKLTTKFDDWIEKDLLKISPWDVRRLGIEDYALVAVESGGRIGVQLDKKYRIDLSYDDKDAKWSLVKMEAFDKEGAAKDEQLPEGEELATAKLNDLRNALGDLKIVDVARKPSGLSAELKAEESFTNDREAVTSMQQRGFLPLKSGEILSTDGETIVGMRDGVEYVLRFGAPTTVAAETKASEGDAAGKDAAGETGGRYLLVMARFNEKLLEKPTLDPLPDVPGEGEKAADDKDKDAEGKKDAAAKEKDGDAAAGEKPADAAESLKKADETEAAAQAALENRRRVERENRRKQDAYDDKVKAAQKRVRELNNRFADWYYVVSDKEYAKIHLGRQTMVQKKEETKEAAAAPVEPAP
ncbi:MAG: hypothetical protein RLZZ111_2003 [Planctomycetota bacterium]|jgi:hypothetical protein